MLGKRILLICGGFATFVFMTGILVASVKHEPEGIPKRLLPMYKAKIREVKENLAYAEAVGETIHATAYVAEPFHDFGLLYPHTTATHTFLVENHGKAPLHIAVSETTCKCTVGKVGEEEIMPGGAGKVTLTWNTGYKVDSYEQTARIVTNDPLHPQMDLTISGRVRADLVCPRQISFGSMNPSEVKTKKFLVFSQRWEDFYLNQAESDLRAFSWDAEPIDLDDRRLHDTGAIAAWEISVTSSGSRRGTFQEDVRLQFRSSEENEPIERTLVADGKVRAPINFYSPDIHAQRGLEFGVLHNDEAHEYSVVARLRGPGEHRLEVLDIQPPELQATIEPSGSDGQYRLSITVPKDCPMVTFNSDQKHGYVEVGDPNDPEYKNWFPLYGAVMPAGVKDQR